MIPVLPYKYINCTVDKTTGTSIGHTINVNNTNYGRAYFRHLLQILPAVPFLNFCGHFHTSKTLNFYGV